MLISIGQSHRLEYQRLLKQTTRVARVKHVSYQADEHDSALADSWCAHNNVLSQHHTRTHIRMHRYNIHMLNFLKKATHTRTLTRTHTHIYTDIDTTNKNKH